MDFSCVCVSVLEVICSRQSRVNVSVMQNTVDYEGCHPLIDSFPSGNTNIPITYSSLRTLVKVFDEGFAK